MRGVILFWSILVLVGCMEEHAPASTVFRWEPARYGEFVTDACGVGLKDFENSHWEHREDSSTLYLEMAQSCAVYQGTIDFELGYHTPHMSPWVVNTQMCNRCSDTRYLRWVRYRGTDENASPLMEPPEENLLSFGLDFDGIVGPDSGDGVSGFIRYLDRNGAEYVTQCRKVNPSNDTYKDHTPDGKVVHQIEVGAGEWVGTASGHRLRVLSDNTYPQIYQVKVTPDGERVNERWPQARYQPIDFTNLERTEYLWPKFHAEPSNVVADFPFAECERLGYSSYDYLWDFDTVGGILVKDRGFQDWIAHEFDYEVPQKFIDEYLPWQNLLPPGLEDSAL